MAKLIKKYMVERGRDNFTVYLAEILGITKQWSSKKLRGDVEFTIPELRKLIEVFDFPAEELKAALME